MIILPLRRRRFRGGAPSSVSVSMALSVMLGTSSFREVGEPCAKHMRGSFTESVAGTARCPVETDPEVDGADNGMDGMLDKDEGKPVDSGADVWYWYCLVQGATPGGVEAAMAVAAEYWCG